MLDELVTRVSSPEELLGLSRTQLDGLLLSCIAGRANNADPIAAKFVYEDEIVGLYPVGIGATFQQRQAVDHVLMESWQRLQSGGLIMQRLEEAKGLYEEWALIGTREGWEAVLRAKGLRLRGHRLVRRHS